MNEIETPTPNGVVAPKSITLPGAALRRLARLFARSEGAQMVAQAATTAAQAAQNEVQRELADACQEEGLHLSPNGNVDIDWRTGVITVVPSTEAVPQS